MICIRALLFVIPHTCAVFVSSLSRAARVVGCALCGRSCVTGPVVTLPWPVRRVERLLYGTVVSSFDLVLVRVRLHIILYGPVYNTLAARPYTRHTPDTPIAMHKAEGRRIGLYSV